MCGIVGYVGSEAAVPILLEGLARLEYRGYDSAGIAYLGSDGVAVEKRAGKVADLAAIVDVAPSTVGIGHTRWATHGAPNSTNAHPHSDCSGRFAIVHNGIIENQRRLRSELEAEGHTFLSETDSEILAHLIERSVASGSDLAGATRSALAAVEGSVALVVIDAENAGHLVAARRDSPLLVGVGEGMGIFASDIPAILPHTNRVLVIEDERVVDLEPGLATVTDLDGAVVEVELREIEWASQAPEKSGYPHFMLKEIYEQPAAVKETVRGRYEDGRIELDVLRGGESGLIEADKVVVVACGTSFHAGLVAKYAIERWARMPVEIDVASEFRYRDPVLDERALVVAVSQSGETADTVAACRHAKELGARVVAVCNVVDSSMAREADAVLYTRAGPEIGVAATKTFTAQIAAMELLALYLAQLRKKLGGDEVTRIYEGLLATPALIAAGLDRWRETARDLAARFSDVRDYFFLGRGVGYPVAMEGALKLKEISYLRAEGYPAGEMKHGPIALIEPGVVVPVVATRSRVEAKLLSNVAEMRARGATVVAVVNAGDGEAADVADYLFEVDEVDEMLSPLLDVVPFQLLAYEVAVARGFDVDKPRNLAKTVTVE